MSASPICTLKLTARNTLQNEEIANHSLSIICKIEFQFHFTILYHFVWKKLPSMWNKQRLNYQYFGLKFITLVLYCIIILLKVVRYGIIAVCVAFRFYFQYFSFISGILIQINKWKTWDRILKKFNNKLILLFFFIFSCDIYCLNWLNAVYIKWCFSNLYQLWCKPRTVKIIFDSDCQKHSVASTTSISIKFFWNLVYNTYLRKSIAKYFVA